MSGQKRTAVSFFNRFLSDVFIFIHVLHIENIFFPITKRVS